MLVRPRNDDTASGTDRLRPVRSAWLFGRTGPGASNHFEAGGVIRSNADVRYLSLMDHFLPVAIRYDGSSPVTGHRYQVNVGPMYSDARGTVRIRSTDSHVRPAGHPIRLFVDRAGPAGVGGVGPSHPEDSGPTGLGAFSGGGIFPGPEAETDDQILDRVAGDAETALHPLCVARMGTGEDAVVDPKSFRVHGVDGLRVVDASVMPCVANANIHPPTMMIAERAADAIGGDTPLPPEPVDHHTARTD